MIKIIKEVTFNKHTTLVVHKLDATDLVVARRLERLGYLYLQVRYPNPDGTGFGYTSDQMHFENHINLKVARDSATLIYIVIYNNDDIKLVKKMLKLRG